jgi:glucose/arabinose dehydrogenase
MAATIHRLHSASKHQAHMMVAKTNPWLDTVLATEPTRPSTPTQSPKSDESPKMAGTSNHIQPELSTSKPKNSKTPAESSLDEAFQAAIKAIVPERLEATRIAQAKVQLPQGAKKDTPKVTSFTQITSGNPTSTARKLLKNPKGNPVLQTAKETPLLHTAIECLALDRLHTVLYKALNESPKARSVFERELLVPSSLDPGDDKLAVAARQNMGKKRLRFEKCRWCKEEFDVTSNPDHACQHHTGEIVFKKCTREYDDGLGDDLSNMDEKRENRPRGFTWDCCQADEDDDGCETSAHEIHDVYDTKRSRRC